MKLTEYFKDFLDATVNLNDSRIDTLDRRVAAITSFLANDATFRDYFIDVLPQGSYAHRTIIKPVGNREYDADVLLVMEEHPSWTPAQYTLELRRAFNQSATYKDMAHMRSRCVYIDYADAFHVDVVPFVASRSSITYNKGGWDGQGSWHPSRPEDFALWLEQKYRVVGGGRLPAVIRLLKYLRDFKTTFSVKSVILTILVCNVVSDTKTLLDPAYYADLPTAFVHVLEDLASYLKTNPTMPAIRDPGNSGTNFSERWDQAGFENFSSCIQMYATKSRAALDATTVDASLKAWQEIFGSSFNKTVKKAITAAAAVPDIAPLEQFIDQDLRIPVRLTERVRLVGRVRQSGIQRAYDLPIRADRVDKGRTIDFRLEDCSVTGDFEVYWKTRNYGEVSTPEEMRGQIVKGGTSHTEQTRWRGTDYVEVYIVKDGVCVASDRQQVIITNRK